MTDERSDFDGFAPGSPTRGRLDPEPSSGRPPGLSAFGDQRVRVPGAALTGLTEAYPPPAANPPVGDGPNCASATAVIFARRRLFLCPTVIVSPIATRTRTGANVSPSGNVTVARAAPFASAVCVAAVRPSARY